ncbi:hypothetical protein AAZX31_03G071700 [Glycine max]
MYPNLARMSPQWLPNGTTRTTHPSPATTEEKQKQATKSSHPFEKAFKLTPLATIHSMDPSKENPTPQPLWSKEVQIWNPHTKSIPSHLVGLTPIKQDLNMIGGILKQMYVLDEAIAYPPKLHISRCTDIKMVSDRVCPRLPICNEGKKKGFKLYFNEKEAKQRVDATT